MSESEPTAAPPEPAARPPGRLQRLLGGFYTSRHFTPIPTLFAMTGTVILLSLGTWQMQRLQEKNTLLQTMRHELAQAPTDLRVRPPRTALDWRKLHYRPVILRGTWLTLHPFKLAPRTFEEQVGYQLLLPLRLGDGQVVLVNRGFVRNGASVLSDREAVAEVQGVARIAETAKPSFRPDNIPARGQWSWIDLEALGDSIGVSALPPVVIYEARDLGRDAYPIGGQIPLPDHNRHWHYAITWYALALILLAVWVAASKARPQAQTGTLAAESHVSDPVALRGLYPEATD